MTRDHRQDYEFIIETKRERLIEFQKQEALEGSKTDPKVKIEIKNIEKEIKQLEQDLSDPKKYHITFLPLILEKYDEFFELFDKDWTYIQDPIMFCKHIITQLGVALDAEQVLIVQDNGTKWEILHSYESKNVEHTVETSLAKIQDLIHRAVKLFNDSQQNTKSHKYANISIGTHSHSHRSFVFAPLPDTSPSEVLILQLNNSGYVIDTGLAAILDAIIRTTKSFKTSLPSKSIVMSCLNELKRNFGYVSDKMYEKQFKLFQQQLENIVMYYEPIISLSHYPYISRWEALARNKDTKKTPKELFETCELWGIRFQVELDVYCLNLAVESYTRIASSEGSQGKNDSKKRQGRVGDILPLSVNVYPATLLIPKYRTAIQDIAKLRLIPLDKLILELSEKRPLPIPVEPFLDEKDEVSWFRERLIYYTNLGITFAIDDYGVGFASASRLSRLEPAIVKIDRDALLHTNGSYTIQQVLKIEQESMGKMLVVIEGLDDESKLSLAELYQMGVRYVQGHATITTTCDNDHCGKPVPAEKIYRLDSEQEDQMIRRIGYSINAN